MSLRTHLTGSRLQPSHGATGPWTGEPSLAADIVVRLLRAARSRGERPGAKSPFSFIAPDVTDQGPPRWVTSGVRLRGTAFAGWPVWTLSPPSGKSTRYVVALHGGGYTTEATLIHWLDYRSLVRKTGATVIVPIYPVAPHGNAATVVPATADLISSQVAAHGADAVSVYGDSAGGGLAVAALQESVRRGESVPGRAVLISPWLDATLSDPTSDRIDDPILDAEKLRAAGRLWAGELDPADPRVSPLFGSLDGLPPMTVYSGSLDVLAADTVRLGQRADEEAADITFIMYKDGIHGWPGFGIMPEARRATKMIHAELTEH